MGTRKQHVGCFLWICAGQMGVAMAAMTASQSSYCRMRAHQLRLHPVSLFPARLCVLQTSACYGCRCPPTTASLLRSTLDARARLTSTRRRPSRLQRLLQPSKQQPGSCTAAAPGAKPAAEAHGTAVGVAAAAYETAQARKGSERAVVDAVRVPGSPPSSVPHERQQQQQQRQQQQTSPFKGCNACCRGSVPGGSSASPGGCCLRGRPGLLLRPTVVTRACKCHRGCCTSPCCCYCLASWQRRRC